MWEVDNKEGLVSKNWCFQTAVMKETLESPLNSKIQPVNPKGNQSWILIGRTDAEAPILWPPDANSRLIGKDPDAGKDWRQKEKRAAEDEMVREHHQLSGRESEQTLGDNGRHRSLACCSPWVHKESEMTQQLKNNNNIILNGEKLDATLPPSGTRQGYPSHPFSTLYWRS